MRIPIEEVVARFSYSPISGELLRAGEPCGTLDQYGYVMVRFENYGSRSAHQLAFAIMLGRWPIGEVDHINGVRSDNSWDNLREVTSSQQKKNTKLRSDNPFGLPGVHYDPRYRRPWYSVTHSEGTRHIERFTDFFEACCARKSAELRFGFHKNHGRKV